jgi:hypothetical protein
VTSSDARARLLEVFELQRAGFVALNCPFYEGLGDEIEVDIRADGPIAALLGPFVDEPFEQMYVLRLLGRVHRLAIAGTSPALAAHFPSTGGDGDAAAAIVALRELIASDPDALGDWSARPPQTNEVGRAAALMSGLLFVAAELGLPLALREIGASAGLNLRLDRYWYEQDGVGCGDPSSAVRFVDLWNGGSPPIASGIEVVDRRGCDPDPIDAGSSDGALTLLSYIWPEPAERFARASGAIEQAQSFPVTIDQADARDWVPEQLAARTSGATLVVMHSVMWQYVAPDTQASILASLDEAGRTASPDAPIARVRLEPHEQDFYPAELRATIWDGHTPEPQERLLATTTFHGGRLDWVAGTA